MTTEQQLRERLRKIRELFEGARTAGERSAAEAAMRRVSEALGSLPRPVLFEERMFTFADMWQRRLFTALCRRQGIEPYRYYRQRYTTVMIRANHDMIDRILWPEFLQLSDVLNDYLSEVTDRIIKEEVFGDTSEAVERPAQIGS